MLYILRDHNCLKVFPNALKTKALFFPFIPFKLSITSSNHTSVVITITAIIDNI